MESSFARTSELRFKNHENQKVGKMLPGPFIRFSDAG